MRRPRSCWVKRWRAASRLMHHEMLSSNSLSVDDDVCTAALAVKVTRRANMAEESHPDEHMTSDLWGQRSCAALLLCGSEHEGIIQVTVGQSTFVQAKYISRETKCCLDRTRHPHEGRLISSEPEVRVRVKAVTFCGGDVNPAAFFISDSPYICQRRWRDFMGMNVKKNERKRWKRKSNGRLKKGAKAEERSKDVTNILWAYLKSLPVKFLKYLTNTQVKDIKVWNVLDKK